MKNFIKLSLLLFCLSMGIMLASATPGDRETLLKDKTRRSTVLLRQQMVRNQYFKKRRLFSQMDFVIDEFAKGNKPYISEQAYAEINNRLRWLHLRTGVEYYVLITPHVPIYVKSNASAEKIKAIRKQIDEEALAYSQNVAKAAKIGEVGVGNGVLLTYVRQEITVGGKVPNWIKNDATGKMRYVKGSAYYAKPLLVLGKLFDGSPIAQHFEQHIFSQNVTFSQRNQVMKYLSYSVLKGLMTFSRVADTSTLPDLYKAFESGETEDKKIWEILDKGIEQFELFPFFDEHKFDERFQISSNGFKSALLAQKSADLFFHSLKALGYKIEQTKWTYLYDQGSQGKLSLKKAIKTLLSKHNYKLEELNKVFDRTLTRIVEDGGVWVEGFTPDLPYTAETTEEACLRENLHYMHLAFADFMRDGVSDNPANTDRKTLVTYVPLIPSLFQNHAVVKLAGWDNESMVNILALKATYFNDVPTIPSFTKYANYVSKSLDNIQQHYGNNLTAALAKTELEQMIRQVRAEVEQRRAKDNRNAALRKAPEVALLEENWQLKPYVPGNTTIAALPHADAVAGYRAMQRAFAYFFGSTANVEASTEASAWVKATENLQQLASTAFSNQTIAWSATNSHVLNVAPDSKGILAIQDFWKNSNAEDRQAFMTALAQLNTNPDQVTKANAQQLLKTYLKALFKRLPANFPKTLAEMQGYKSELLAAPRYQLVFEAVKPLFANFSTKKLARLIGGIVALTKESDLAADASFAVNATWATNMTKASIASNVAAGVGAIAPALGAALTTSAILIMKVVVVAIAVYAAYRALKLMWKLAVWVANKIGEMVRKPKPDDDQCSKYTSLAEQVVCVFEPHLGQLGQPSGQQGLQIAQRMIQVNGNAQVLDLITKRKKDLVVQIKGLAGSNTALPTKATEFLKDLGVSPSQDVDFMPLETTTNETIESRVKLLAFMLGLPSDKFSDLFKPWKALYSSPPLRRSTKNIQSLSNNHFLCNYMIDNSQKAANILNLRNAAWKEGLNLLSNAHQIRMNKQWKRFLTIVNDERKFDIYQDKFKLLKQDRLFREYLMSVVGSNASNRIKSQIKGVNIFWGKRPVKRDNNFFEQNFIAFSCKHSSLLSKLTELNISRIGDRVIIQKPADNDSPERYVKAYLNTNKYDAEVTMFDDWMKTTHIMQGERLDWRNINQRTGIKRYLQTSTFDFDFHSTMTPCPSCEKVFIDIFGSRFGELDADHNWNIFVKSGTIYTD